MNYYKKPKCLNNRNSIGGRRPQHISSSYNRSKIRYNFYELEQKETQGDKQAKEARMSIVPEILKISGRNQSKIFIYESIIKFS